MGRTSDNVEGLETLGTSVITAVSHWAGRPTARPPNNPC